MTTNTQKTPQKQSNPNLETAMKSILTMVALVATLTTILAPQIAEAAPPSKQCIKLSQELGKNCSSAELLKAFAKAKCSEEMKNDVCPPAPAPEAAVKAAPAPIEDLATKPESKIGIGTPKASEADFSLCEERSFDWYVAVFPTGQIADYASKAPDRMADKMVANPGTKTPPNAWRKAGITPKMEKDINDSVLSGLPIGFNAATNNLRKFLPREELDPKMVKMMERICKQNEDKSWNCNGADQLMVERARAFYGALTTDQKSKDIDALFARIADDKALKSLARDADRNKADPAMSQIGIACSIVLIAPNAPREFTLAGSEYQGRKKIAPNQAKKGQVVYILRMDGSIQGPVVEELNDGTVKVSTSKENPFSLMEDEVKNGTAKLYADAFCGDCNDQNAVNPNGKTVTITDPATGNSVTGVGKSYNHNNTIEATGAIQSLTGKPIRVFAGYTLNAMDLDADPTVKGIALNGFQLSVGWEFRPSTSWFITPMATGGFGYVTGESSARRFDTPSNDRVVGILGAGLKAGFDTGSFSPYVVAEGYGLPGLGLSGGIGTQWHFSKQVALDASVRWTYLPDTGVTTGIRNLNTMENVGLNGLGLTAGVVF